MKPEHLQGLIQQLAVSVQAHLLEIRAEEDHAERIHKAFQYAAADHSQMIAIHPFTDGNGRWARIATTLFLVDCGYPIGSILRSKDKHLYIAASDRCIDHGKPGDLATLLLSGYIRSMQQRVKQ